MGLRDKTRLSRKKRPSFGSLSPKFQNMVRILVIRMDGPAELRLNQLRLGYLPLPAVGMVSCLKTRTLDDCEHFTRYSCPTMNIMSQISLVEKNIE
jgi:hypothetical protein